MTYLTIAEARDALRARGVAVNTSGMYRLLKQGRLPHVRLNRLYVTDIDAFLNARAQASTQPMPTPRSGADVSSLRVPPAPRLDLPARRRFGTPARNRRTA